MTPIREPTKHHEAAKKKRWEPPTVKPASPSVLSWLRRLFKKGA